MDNQKPAFALLLAILVALPLSMAQELRDTTIEYTPYREIVPNDAGVIYQIKIENTGNRERSYEIIPDTEAIQQYGTYRVDPEYRFTLEKDEERISFFYLAFDSRAQGRVSVPVHVVSGNQTTTIELAARAVGPFQQRRFSIMDVLRTLAIVLIIAMLILIIISIVRRGRKKKEDKESDVETYY